MEKRTSIEAAIRRIQPGSKVAIGGMLTYRRPMALVAEIVRQSIEGLTIIGWTLGIETEILLLHENVVKTIRTGYMGLDLFGVAPAYRKAVENGRVNVIEETESTLGFGIRAALQGVDYMPARTLMGTDLLQIRPDISVLSSPYSNDRYPAVPKLQPDVALIHVPIADTYGNAVIENNFGIDSEIALLADYTIVSAEEVVPVGDPRLKGSTRIIGRTVDAVVEAKNGAWPTSCFPNYPIDAMALVDYVEAWQRDTSEVEDLLNRWVEKVRMC